jgi:NAD(P)-dependent dehydrogenase (short-subunit alcohol dehydrogenase family)
MTIALAREYAKHNITANLVAPGWFNTWRNRHDFPDEASLADKGKYIPLGRIGGEGDVEGLVVLLCSEAGRYITGQTIYVDGGMTAR